MQEACPKTRPSPRFLLFAGLLLAVPRIVRMAYPALWVEDSFYLYAGDLVSKGVMPYKEFVHTQYPGVEFLLALAYKMLGPSTRTAELATQVFAWMGSMLVLVLGTRMKNRRTGLLAAFLLAFHSLLFRYHLCERELFALVPAIALMWLVFEGSLKGYRAAGFFLLACFGLSFKLTFTLPCLASVLYLLWVGRRRDAVAAALLAGAAVVGVTLLLWLLFGEPFLWQALLYHFAKGANVHGLLQRINVPRLCLDWALAVGGPAVLFLSLDRDSPRAETEPARTLPIAWVIPEGVLFTAFSPNLWPHNYLSVLPGLCLLSALWLDRVFRREHWQGDGRLLYHKGLKCALPLVLLFTVVPLRNHQWERGSVHGFGFMSRGESQEMARIVQRAASAQQRILVPEYLAVDAQRRLLLDDRMEAAGAIGRFRDLAAEEGLLNACETMKREDFWVQTEAAQSHWRPEAVEGILRGRIPVVIPFLHAKFREELFLEAGYDYREFTWYRVWISPNAPQR